MVLRGTAAGEPVTVSLKPAALSVMFGAAEVLTYDRGGRLYCWFAHGRTLRRGLDGSVLEKRPAGSHTFARRRLAPGEAAAALDGAAARIGALRDAAAAGSLRWDETARWSEAELASLHTVLERAAAFDAYAALRDRAAFERVYDPVGILPPDQYLALVLQATEGCSFNSCTFCDFYRARRYRVKSPSEFRDHARAVRAFLGDSLLMRRSIFLGEANAMAAPFARLRELMQVAREEIGPLPMHAFLDAFTGHRKTAAEYRVLAELGLRRVSIGMESGHDPLLAFVRKPSRTADVLATVAALKAAGVGVSLIVLLGLGGDRFARAHAADSARALAEMPLGGGDIIYFSELVERPDAPYAAQARAAGIRPLTPEELRSQRARIVTALPRTARGPAVARYDIHEFVY
jgi:hypothetical protein